MFVSEKEGEVFQDYKETIEGKKTQKTPIGNINKTKFVEDEKKSSLSEENLYKRRLDLFTDTIMTPKSFNEENDNAEQIIENISFKKKDNERKPLEDITFYHKKTTPKEALNKEAYIGKSFCLKQNTKEERKAKGFR